jgi:hypothetical protein
VLNPSYADFLARLRTAGVAVCDLTPALQEEIIARTEHQGW